MKTTVTATDKPPDFDPKSINMINDAIINGPLPVIIFDNNGKIQYVNHKFTAMTGYQPDEVIGRNISFLTCAECCHNTISSAWENILMDESWFGESEGCRKDSTHYWEQSSITPLHDQDGNVRHYLKISYDITHRKRLEREFCAAIALLQEKEKNLQETCKKLKQATHELKSSKTKLQHLSQKDALTGLLNRRGFQRELRSLKTEVKRDDQSIGVILIDIDHFKAINDNYGHAVGDYVLRKLSSLLKSLLRMSDLVCRYGGDEIVIAMPIVDPGTINTTAKRILKEIRKEKFMTGKIKLPVSVSIGVASTGVIHTTSVQNLVKMADHALYYSKRNGRNTMTVWQNNDTFCLENGEVMSSDFNLKTQTFHYVFNTLVEMLDAREKATGEHSRRVSKLVSILARHMGLPPRQVELCEQGALLHDIGKIIIPDSILLKVGKLTSDEWDVIKKHPQTGFDILKSNPEFQEIAEVVLSHQERFDGTGYPRQLKGEQICIGALIFAIADSYDAIRVGRPYAPSRSFDEAREEILRCSGTQFDPKVVEAFISCQNRLDTIFMQ